MSTFCRPPETYSQWFSSLQYLADHPADREALALISRGTLPAAPSEQFIARISDTVSRMLTLRCRKFLRQLDTLLAEGELDMIPLAAVRYQKNACECLFYRNLAFLPQKDLDILEEGFTKQLGDFWQRFLRQASRTADQDPRMEEVFYRLKHIRIMTDRRRVAG